MKDNKANILEIFKEIWGDGLDPDDDKSESAIGKFVDMKEVYSKTSEIDEKAHNDSIIELTNNIARISLSAQLNALERYECKCHGDCADMSQCKDGEWIRYDDVKELIDK